MFIINQLSNLVFRSSKSIIVIIILFSHLILFPSIITASSYQNGVLETSSQENRSKNIKNTVNEDSSFIKNNSFDIDSLFNYMNEVYSDVDGIFKETAGAGFKTSIATYESLSILRYLGLDYYLFGSEWQDSESKITNYLISNLRDRDDSGGYRLTIDVDTPSLEGTFGVVTSLWIMNEPTLKEETLGLLDFIINSTFNVQNKSFHEPGLDSTIKATFQALSIIDLSYRVATFPEFLDIFPEFTETVNNTVREFMGDYSVGILNYLDNMWQGDVFFDANNSYQTEIANTWYAMHSINILEKYSDLIGITLPKGLSFYKDDIINWMKSQVKQEGTTKGGFGTSEYATVAETGMGYATLHLLNATDEINHTETMIFINSSQFLDRENRSYLSSEMINFGGFSPNNLSHSITQTNKQVNIHDTYFAVLTLLLSGKIFESIDLSLETSHFKNNPNINRSDMIVQGEVAEIDQLFTIYDYNSHGSLEISTIVDNWFFTYSNYTEANQGFIGKLNASYTVNLENDSESTFNWTLGDHHLTNIISLRDLPIIHSPNYYINSTVFVGYSPKIVFNETLITPGDNVSTTIFYQNRSTSTYETQNITSGTVSVNITSPDGKISTLFINEPFNMTSEAISFNLNFSKQDLLGTWELAIRYNDSYFELVIYVPVEITDSVTFFNVSKLAVYYPGELMNLNVSLRYSNGQFTPKANASLVFISNHTTSEVFNIKLDYLDDNIYTTKNHASPIQFLYGFYNVSVHLTWNVSSGYQINTLKNETLPNIQFKGNPIIFPRSSKTDYRNLTLKNDNTIYYGESINLSFSIGFESTSKIYNITDTEAIIKGGLINISIPSIFIQSFNTKQVNESFFVTGLINTNLPSTTFGTRFMIKSEWNNSFVELRSSLNSSEIARYNITLSGDFSISDIMYIGITEVNGDLVHSLDSVSVLSVTFNVVNVANVSLESLLVPNLNLYGILNFQNDPEDLNQSLPSITSAFDENRTPIYQISVPSQDLKPDTYEITLYTWSAIEKNYEVGKLDPGFRIVRTLTIAPLIQIHEVFIILAGAGIIILGYLNLRKLR